MQKSNMVSFVCFLHPHGNAKTFPRTNWDDGVDFGKYACNFTVFVSQVFFVLAI